MEDGWVVHLLHYIPERRGRVIDTIEDIIRLHDVKLSVKALKRVRAVRLVPELSVLPFGQSDGRIEFVVPVVAGHQMIELCFGE
jgi:hypothetical protein